MFKLDNNLLEELGLGSLPPPEKNMMLRHIYETLEFRVGMRLAEQMTNEQMADFETLMPLPEDTPEIKAQKQKGALSWLETNFPNYKQVVGEALEKLKAEIKQSAPQIVAASQQSQSSPQVSETGNVAQFPQQPAQQYPSQPSQMPGQAYPQDPTQQPPMAA